MKRIVMFAMAVGMLYMWCSIPSKIDKAVEERSMVDDYVRVYDCNACDLAIILNVSESALERIKKYEGCALTAYMDSNGMWAIGYGHLGAKSGERITEKRADELFACDIKKVEDYLVDLGICRTQGEFDSLASFIYNVGIPKFERSTLLYEIRNGNDVEDIKNEIRKWCHANGEELKGLKERREWEASLWM